MTSNFDYIWKIMVGGAGGVGKTTLIHRYLHHEFLEDTKLTIGVQMHSQVLRRQQRNINLVFWDLGGQERFHVIQPRYCKGAAGAFVMFDMTDPSTLEATKQWISMFKENAAADIPIVLVGTKLDLLDQDAIDRVNEAANAIASETGCSCYTATSSKLNVNVDETILFMVDLLVWQAYQEEGGSGLTPSQV